MKSIAVVAILALAASAFAYENEVLVEGHSLESITVDQITQKIEPGTIVVLSEQHDLSRHHEHQVIFLESLAKRLEHVSVGMEFFPRTRQSAVDKFLSGLIDEADFLANVEWGGNNFGFYRRQVLFPVDHGGTTLALNAPRALTAKIAKQGLESLSDEERALLPDGFTLGNDGYKERFLEVMSGHDLPEEKLNNYFAAQSTWDETMADTACTYIKNHPEDVMTILVGDFHASYGGGLPDRLKARGCEKLIVISQIAVADLSDPSKVEEIAPHAKWGDRADYIWAIEVKEAVKKRRLLRSMNLGLFLN